MPAVNPKRLRFQIEALMAFFNTPQKFHQHLQDLFSLYANRHLRFGDSSPIRPLIPVYNLPPPVIRQLNLDLDRHIKEHPEDALALADELWKDNYMEIKQTAIVILGAVPISEPTPILSRIANWISPKLDKALISNLFSTGTRQLQDNFPDEWEKFVVSFLKENKPDIIALGIKGLSEGLKNPGFKNLPAVFRYISPFILDPHPHYKQDLQHLVSGLVQHSPTETAFFLKQTLVISKSSETAQLIKDCLDLFPEKQRQDLKAALRK